jgi:hypothetical protein
MDIFEFLEEQDGVFNAVDTGEPIVFDHIWVRLVAGTWVCHYWQK